MKKNINFFNKKDYNKKQSIFFIIILMITLLVNIFFYGYNFRAMNGLLSNQTLVEKITTVKSILANNYLFSKDVPEDQILDGTIEGLVSSYGDPYTRYVSSKNYEKFTTEIKGEFGGIGVTIKNNSTVVPEEGIQILETISGSGAEQAGIESNDKIISVDGVDITGMEVDKALELIKGQKGTDVSLEVVKENETKPSTVTITRDVVEVPVVSARVLKDRIGYISISQFTQTIVHQFDEEYKKIEPDIDSLIIDLRFNTGGSVPETVEILSRFIGENQVAVTMEKKNYSIDVTTEKSDYLIDKKIILLVNQYTASASEIFAGALRSYDKATILGTKTFGKGLVQETTKLDDSSLLIITVAKYLTPSKEDINKKGLEPDILVELSETSIVDTQLEEAIKILEKESE